VAQGLGPEFKSWYCKKKKKEKTKGNKINIQFTIYSNAESGRTLERSTKCHMGLEGWFFF
jgi:hypothetical protein